MSLINCPYCGAGNGPLTTGCWKCKKEFTPNIQKFLQNNPPAPAIPKGALTCPRCGAWVTGNYHGCIILAAIFLFPIGLLALLMPKTY